MIYAILAFVLALGLLLGWIVVGLVRYFCWLGGGDHDQ
jgi:uncharacterized membrane protein YciS (DUF1049 family)